MEVGQTVVKRKIHAFLSFYKVPKMPMLQGFFTLLIFRSGVPCSRSQMSRAPNCATPRYDIKFWSFCVEVGQTVVKRKFHAVLRFYKVRKVRTVKGFSGLLLFYGNLC